MLILRLVQRDFMTRSRHSDLDKTTRNKTNIKTNICTLNGNISYTIGPPKLSNYVSRCIFVGTYLHNYSSARITVTESVTDATNIDKHVTSGE